MKDLRSKHIELLSEQARLQSEEKVCYDLVVMHSGYIKITAEAPTNHQGERGVDTEY